MTHYRTLAALAALILAVAACSGDSPFSRKKKAQDSPWTAAIDGNLPTLRAMVSADPSLVRQQNSAGLTLLHLAAWNGRLETAEFLLEQGADANVRDYNGDTPLHFAASWGFPDLCRVLLAHGAKVNARNDAGKTPLSRVSPPRPEIVALLRQHGGEE